MPADPGPSEFDDAVEIEKFQRYIVRSPRFEGEVAVGGFALLDRGGRTHRFMADALTLAHIAMVIGDIARASNRVVRTGSIAGFAASSEPISGARTADGQLQPFVGSQIRLKRALILFEQLGATAGRYHQIAAFEETPIATRDGRHRWLITLKPAPPAAIPNLIGEIIYNTRSALDILLFDIARVRGIPIQDDSRLAFPFARKESDLKKMVASSVRPLGSDVEAAVLALKTYRDGDSLLYKYNILSNIEKHRMVLPVHTAILKRWDLAKDLTEQLQEARPDLPFVVAVLGDDGMTTPFMDGQIIELDDERSPLSRYEPGNGLITMRFGEETPFARESVPDVLGRFIDLATEIAKDFHEKFGASPD